MEDFDFGITNDFIFRFPVSVCQHKLTGRYLGIEKDGETFLPVFTDLDLATRYIADRGAIGDAEPQLMKDKVTFVEFLKLALKSGHSCVALDFTGNRPFRGVAISALLGDLGQSQ